MSFSSFRQVVVGPGSLPPGTPRLTEHLAVIAISIEDAERRWGLAFQEDCDDLGNLRFALVLPVSGVPFWMQRNEGDPPNSLLVISSKDETDLGLELARICRVLDLRPEELIWKNPRCEA